MKPVFARYRGRSLFMGLVLATAMGILMLAQMQISPASATTPGMSKPLLGFPLAAYTIREDEGPALIAVQLNAAPVAGQEIVVRYTTLAGTAAAGTAGDYLDTTGLITFTHSSSTTQTFPVDIIDDGVLNEPDETVNLILTLLTPDTATLDRTVALLVIVDDDLVTATPTVESDEFVHLQPIFAPDKPMPTLTPTPPCAYRARDPLTSGCLFAP